MTDNTNDRAMTLLCRLDDFFAGEDMEDVGKTLKSFTALYLLKEEPEDMIAFFLEVMQRMKGYIEIDAKMTPADRKRVLRDIERRMAGH